MPTATALELDIHKVLAYLYFKESENIDKMAEWIRDNYKVLTIEELKLKIKEYSLTFLYNNYTAEQMMNNITMMR
jgi:hypothetical protein